MRRAVPSAHRQHDGDGSAVAIDDAALSHALGGEREAIEVVLEEELGVLGVERGDGVPRHLADADAALARGLAARELAVDAEEDPVEVAHGLHDIHLVVRGVRLAPLAERVDRALGGGLAAADQLDQRLIREAEGHDGQDERVDLVAHHRDALVADDGLDLVAHPLLEVVARVHEGRGDKA